MNISTKRSMELETSLASGMVPFNPESECRYQVVDPNAAVRKVSPRFEAVMIYKQFCGDRHTIRKPFITPKT